MVPKKLPQVNMSYPKVKKGASEEEEVTQLVLAKLDALWDKVRSQQ